MKKIKFVLFALVAIMFFSCSSDDDSSSSQNNDEIVGKWENNDGIVGLYYYFSPGGSWVWYNGSLLNETKTGEYSYDDKTKTIHCNEKDGYSMTIKVSFIDIDNAYFAWKYDVLADYDTIKVKRTSHQ